MSAPEAPPRHWGWYRVAYCELFPSGERANFGIVLWGPETPPVYRCLADWSRFTAFTGYDPEHCKRWLTGWATEDGLARYARWEERGSIGLTMSTLRFTEPRGTLLSFRGRDMLAELEMGALGARARDSGDRRRRRLSMTISDAVIFAIGFLLGLVIGAIFFADDAAAAALSAL